jgi:prefoldin alpha subunit
MDKEQQEMMVKFQMFEQQINHLNQQIQAIEEGINEMSILYSDLNELKNSKGKEILAPFGRGIFVKAKLLSEELMVDVGGKNFVKKSIEDTKKIISEQIKKLEDIKEELTKELEKIDREITKEMLKEKK